MRLHEGAARELAVLHLGDQATQCLLVHVKTPRLFQPFARPDATRGPGRFDCKENRLARGGQRRGQGAPVLPMSQRMRVRGRSGSPAIEGVPVAACAAAFRIFDCQTANASPLGFDRAPSVPSFPFLSLTRVRGAERREGAPIRLAHALRIAARVCETRSPRGAPPAALAIASRLCLSSGPRLRVPAIRPGHQRAPRTGAVIPPGRVPKPPGCEVTSPDRAGAAQVALAQPPPPTPGPLA